jgi:hypothetical protein
MSARPPAPPLTPAEQDRVDAFEAAQYPAEVAEQLEWPLGWKPGPCTECGAPKTACTAPDYCCADCLHLADDWTGYDDAAPDRPDTAAEVEEVEAVARAIAEAQAAHDLSGFPCRCGWDAGFGRGWEERVNQHRLTEQARAALAARRPATEAEQAVERITAVAAQYEAYVAACKAEGIDYDEALETAAADIRAALGGVARDDGQRGRCSNQAPAVAGIAQTAVHCKLPAGHAGWHKGDDGSEWMFRPYRAPDPS